MYIDRSTDGAISIGNPQKCKHIQIKFPPHNKHKVSPLHSSQPFKYQCSQQTNKERCQIRWYLQLPLRLNELGVNPEPECVSSTYNIPNTSTSNGLMAESSAVSHSVQDQNSNWDVEEQLSSHEDCGQREMDCWHTFQTITVCQLTIQQCQVRWNAI